MKQHVQLWYLNVELDIDHWQTEQWGICSSVEEGRCIQGKRNQVRHKHFNFYVIFTHITVLQPCKSTINSYALDYRYGRLKWWLLVFSSLIRTFSSSLMFHELEPCQWVSWGMLSKLQVDQFRIHSLTWLLVY